MTEPSKLKVVELRELLAARNLPTKGLKVELVLRLEEALKLEAEQETISEEIAVIEGVVERETQPSEASPITADSEETGAQDGTADVDMANLAAIAPEEAVATSPPQDQTNSMPMERLFRKTETEPAIYYLPKEV